MKTLLMTLCLGLVFLFPTETSTIVPTSETAATTIGYDLKKRKTVRAGIRFGRRSRNCRGFGICAAYVSTSNSEKGTSAILGFTGNQLYYIRVQKSSVSKADQATYFKEGTFIVEEDFSETLEVEGEKFLMNLKAGKYKVQEEKDSFLLEVGG
jgi:hypothetical protein